MAVPVREGTRMDVVDPSARHDLPRPAPPTRPLSDLVARLRWFGVGRLIAAAISVVLVIGGAWWLVRAPAPAPEAGLPLASGGAIVAGSTLPPPSPPPTSAPSTSSGPSVPATIVVHVAGAVVGPGVYVVAGGARVADALVAAGGVASDGDPDGVNLAAPLTDGQRVYIPRLGEVDPATVPSGAAPAMPAGDGGGGTTADAPSGPLDLNAATAADLEALPGVGPATAAAIVDDRDRNGPFATVDDLDRVSGIGPAKLDALRDLVTV
jgi:competence protein ComEA